MSTTAPKELNTDGGRVIQRSPQVGGPMSNRPEHDSAVRSRRNFLLKTAALTGGALAAGGAARAAPLAVSPSSQQMGRQIDAAAYAPIITPEELLAECAQAKPATIDEALETSEIVLADYLEAMLGGFRYREDLDGPRAVRARMAAVALERVRSVRSSIKDARRSDALMQARVDAWLRANPQYRF